LATKRFNIKFITHKYLFILERDCFFNKFKQFVFESTFLERNPVDNETVEAIRNDEIALLRFGIKWLKTILFKSKDDESLQLNDYLFMPKEHQLNLNSLFNLD